MSNSDALSIILFNTVSCSNVLDVIPSFKSSLIWLLILSNSVSITCACSCACSCSTIPLFFNSALIALSSVSRLSVIVANSFLLENASTEPNNFLEPSIKLVNLVFLASKSSTDEDKLISSPRFVPVSCIFFIGKDGSVVCWPVTLLIPFLNVPVANLVAPPSNAPLNPPAIALSLMRCKSCELSLSRPALFIACLSLITDVVSCRPSSTPSEIVFLTRFLLAHLATFSAPYFFINPFFKASVIPSVTADALPRVNKSKILSPPSMAALIKPVSFASSLAISSGTPISSNAWYCNPVSNS